MVVASACLLPFVFKHLRHIPRHSIKYLIICGWLGNGIPAFLFTYAETEISSSLAGVLNGLTPIFALLIGLLFFKPKIKWFNVLGIILGFVGASSMMLLNNKGAIDAQSAKYGMLVVLATFMYGINVNLIRYKLSEISAITISGAALLSVGFVDLILLCNTDFFQIVKQDSTAQNCLIYILLLGVAGTAVALVWFNQLVKMAGALFASSTTYLIPVVAIVWGMADGEALSWIHVCGMALILLGVWLVNKKERIKLFLND